MKIDDRKFSELIDTISKLAKEIKELRLHNMELENKIERLRRNKHGI